MLVMAEQCSHAKNKRRAFTILWVLAALVLGIVVAILYFPNYARLKQLRSENEKLISKNKELQSEIADFEKKLKRVGKDPYFYEKIARDALGVAKEGEIVIDIQE